jgi:CDP-glycerol glycerophosphotransferase
MALDIIRRVLRAVKRHFKDYIWKLKYHPEATTSLSNAVLFESFSGRLIGDSPKDIFLFLRKNRPDLKLYWTISTSSQAPQGSIGLVRGSRKWLRVLATAKYLVNNANFPSYFRKAQGQVYLQTWHGTPIKRLGREIIKNKLSKIYLQTMDREATFWDYLISPSPYCTEVFPAALNYSGPIIETGYPRNDRLIIQPSGVRSQIRKQLGVADGVNLVLYAPTWRDFNRGPNGQWESENFLKLNAEMPVGFQLAYRGHSNTHLSHESHSTGEAIDLTLFPDVTQLYLAADVLITDYSSVMFDFTVTGKPILFLAPDLSRYEEERGFYFDYRATVPGPVLKTPQDVLDALSRLDKIKNEYAAKYKNWQERFNPLEDGHSTKRVVEIVFSANHG